MSISPTFYARVFCTKVLCEAFLYSHLRFELFLAQEYWDKCSYKMLVKLTTGVNLANVFWAGFLYECYASKFLYSVLLCWKETCGKSVLKNVGEIDWISSTVLMIGGRIGKERFSARTFFYHTDSGRVERWNTFLLWFVNKDYLISNQ